MLEKRLGATSMQSEKLALLVDFDETAVEENVAELLLERFCQGEWQALRNRFREGDLSLREYQELAFRQVAASPEEMQSVVAEQAHLRSGFLDLLSFCKSNDYQLAIVSNGLDFYIQGLLRHYSLEDTLSVFAVGTRFEAGDIRYLYPYATPTCSAWGNCKCRILEEFRAVGNKIIYIGDGRSDLCPASRADFVFARSSLLEHCRAQDIPHQAFEDFNSVLMFLRDGGLAS